MLVYDDGKSQPGLHAIVIGVGYYHHLPGGRGAEFAGHEGMDQLSSPPKSARAFATWLCTKYRNPDVPLRTLDLLLSERADAVFSLPGKAGTAVDRARKNELKTALLAWKSRGDRSADEMLLFYFCGHGIAAGPYMTLLAEDFGADAARALEFAIDFNGMHMGWDKCKARKQIYFVDACRVASTNLIDTMRYSGDPIIPGGARMSEPVRKCPVYFSAMPGTSAHGRRGKASFYTEALIASLDGLGSDDTEGDWRVSTETINRGIRAKLGQLLRSVEGVDQLCEANHVTDFDIHHLPGAPKVPVTVDCLPSAATATAVLSCSDENGGRKVRNTPQAEPWSIELEEGQYEFTASIARPAGAQKFSTSKPVRPPSRRVSIQVT